MKLILNETLTDIQMLVTYVVHCIQWLCNWYSSLSSILVPIQVTSVFEGLHQGRILCAAVANEHTLLTGGDSMVRLCVSCGTHLHCLQSVTSENDNSLHYTNAGVAMDYHCEYRLVNWWPWVSADFAWAWGGLLMATMKHKSVYSASVGLAVIWISVWWSHKYSANGHYETSPCPVLLWVWVLVCDDTTTVLMMPLSLLSLLFRRKRPKKRWWTLQRWLPRIWRRWSESESCVGGEGRGKWVVWLVKFSWIRACVKGRLPDHPRSATSMILHT